MKGIIFNIVEEIVSELFDADTWDDLLAAAGADGAYTALGNYDDTELVAIVDAVSATTGQSAADVWRLVGRAALPKLADRLGDDRHGATDARGFLLSVNDIIHPEVRMQYPDAVPPLFTFDDLPDGALEVVYRSARRLDALAEGLMAGCGDLFDEVVTVTVIDREGLGNDEARFRVHFGAAQP